MKPLVTFLLIGFLTLQCQTEPVKSPFDGLTKLSHTQLFQLQSEGKFNYVRATFVNQEGLPMSDVDKEALNLGKLTRDYYVNTAGQITKVALRPYTMEDKFFEIRFKEMLQDPFEKMNIVEMDCANQQAILEELHDLDQGARTGDGPNLDFQNQDKLISLIKKCGFPSKTQVGEKAMSAVFLILQHAGSRLMAYYYPQMEAAVEKGDIEKSTFALYQDRLLMYHGFSQIYGSQISNDELYKLENPESVNERRAAIGLEPIEEYLKHFELDFQTELQRMQAENKS